MTTPSPRSGAPAPPSRGRLARARERLRGEWRRLGAGLVLIAIAVAVGVVAQLARDGEPAGPPSASVARVPMRELHFRAATAHEQISNPGRGLRYQIAYDAADLSNPWGQWEPADIRTAIRAMRHRYGGGARVVRIDFYLAPFAGGADCRDRPSTCTVSLSRTALDNIAKTLAGVRSAGFQAIVRFAYDIDPQHLRCYTVDTIKRHLVQLAPVLTRFRDVIDAVQAGFVGPWGDWGTSCLGLERDSGDVRAIMTAVLHALPRGVAMQMPVASLRSQVDPALSQRIGISDDYLTLDSSEHDPFAPGLPNGWWAALLTAAPDLLSDGSLPWDPTQARGELAYRGAIDPLSAVRRIQSLHLTTFSAVQGAYVWLRAWRRTPVTRHELARAGLPAAPGWFGGRRGRTARPSLFDYVRDHLGYRLELVGGAVGSGRGPSLPVRLAVRNYGFSAPRQRRPVQLVLVDSAGRLATLATTNVDWRTWAPSPASEDGGSGRPPTYTISDHIDIDDLRPGTYRLGVVIPGPGCGVRLANEGIGWRRGINLLARVRIRPHRP